MIFIDIAIIIVLLFVIFWLICLIFAQLFGAPTVHSSRQAVIDALKLSNLKRDELLIDLGCGSARVLIMAAKEFGAKGIGVDRSPYCYLISKFNVFFSGQSKKIKIIYGSFNDIEDYLRKADVVYLYLLNSVNKKIEKWLFESISGKTRVVSLAFTFEKHAPSKIISTKTLCRKTSAYLYVNAR